MNENTWSKWSSISEIFSSLAIVVTLAFLAVQTNQNTDAINAQVVATKAESRSAIWMMVFKSVDQVAASPRININLESTDTLTAIEEAELDNWLLGFWGTREFVWIQYQDGVVDQLSYDTIVNEVGFLALPKASEWWDQNAETYYDPGFVEVINAMR